MKLNALTNQFWVAVRGIGDGPGLSNERRKRLHLVNQVSAFTGIMTVGYFLFFLLSQLWLPTIISALAALTYAFVLYLNSQHKYRLATVILLFNGNFQISSIALLLGRDAGIHFFLIAAGMSPFLYYSLEKIKLPAMFSALSMLLYLIAEWHFAVFLPPMPLSAEVNQAIYMVTYLSCMTAVVFFSIYMYMGNMRSEQQLELERRRSEELLLNILPQAIATRLKDGETPIADQYDQASILFADLVGYTALADQLTTRESFSVLSDIFSYFDSVVAETGVEKVRTVGDGYYIVSGVPNSVEDHAQRIAKAALKMMEFRQHIRSPLVQGVQLRIGINSGPVVAGVIGSSKFQFDIWGDTVNTASRMESHGVPDKIQVSPSTYELIKDHFDLEYRGRMDIKGKDQMQTWFLRS